MRSYQKCSAVALIVIAAIAAPAKQSKEKTEVAELSRLEKVWNDAYLEGNIEPMEQLLADDFIVTMTDMVTMNKEQSLTLLSSGRLRFPRYETSDLRVRVYNDAAVVTGRLQRTRSINGTNIDDDWRFTKVYVRRSHKWRVVAWHASTNVRL